MLGYIDRAKHMISLQWYTKKNIPRQRVRGIQMSVVIHANARRSSDVARTGSTSDRVSADMR